MRRLAALALTTLSCSAPARSGDTTRPPPPVPVVSPRPDSGPIPTKHAPRAVIEAPHAGAIVTLTATPDASSVLTVDETGGARLWPALDGTREPRVVELPAARELALGTHAEGFTAVVLDEVGGLYLAKLDRDGRTLSHTTHGVEPGYAGVATSARGTIGWRVDHHVVRIDADGAILDDLGTEPQQRVVDIAVAGDRAVAILDRAGTHQARWLALTPRLAWGAWIAVPANVEVGTSIALAPDHAHVAMTVRDGAQHRVLIVDGRGTEVVRREVAGVMHEVRFADARLLAVSGTSGLSWIAVTPDAALSAAVLPSTPALRQRQLLAAGGGVAIWPTHGELMLMTPNETRFLGYDTLSPRVVHPAADGGMVLGAATSFHTLDAALRMTGPVELRAQSLVAQATELQWLGGSDWLVQTSVSSGRAELALVDLATQSRHLVRDQLADAHLLDYEPSTDLVTLSFGGAAQVARLDRAGRTLDRLAGVAAPGPHEQTIFVPLAPAHARGLQLLQITLRDKPTIKWLADARALDKPRATLALDATYAAADAAGHVYAWRTAGSRLDLVVFTDGAQTGTLPVRGPATLWPDPAGTRVAALSASALTLYRLDGTELWTRELAGGHEVLWLTDGALAVTHATGIVRLDAAAGAVSAARCGWGFGLSTKQHPFTPAIEPLCVQLLR